MNKLYFYLAVLIALTITAYKGFEYFTYKQGYLHPAVKIVTIVKTVTKNNIIVREKIVKTKDGTEVIERVIEDRTVTGTESRTADERFPVLPKPSGQYFVGVGIDLNRVIYADIGTKILFFSIIISNPVQPISFTPRIDILLNF